MELVTPQKQQLLKNLAQKILIDNIYTEGIDSNYTAASGKMTVLNSPEPKWLYPFQWLWDTFFICAWSDNVEQSLKDAEKFLNSQHENGFLGHIRYNRAILSKKEYFPPPNIYSEIGMIEPEGEITSKITQPPNIAYGLLEMAKKVILTKDIQQNLTDLFFKTVKYHEYIYTHRIVDGCMVTIHPWEAGDDNSPKWDHIYKKLDKEMNGSLQKLVIDKLHKFDLSFERVDLKIISAVQRPIDPHYYVYLFLIFLYNEWHWNEKIILEKSPFRVIDPMTNSILLKSNLALLELMELLNIKNDDLKSKISAWVKLTREGLDKLWSDKQKIYFTKNLTDNKFIKVETISSYTPLFSGAIDAKKANNLANKIAQLIVENDTEFVVPSTAFKEKEYFEADRYWRGPVWIVINELLAEGLDGYNYNDLAKRLRNDSLTLVYNSLNVNGGFFEYFNALTGTPLGSAKQSWTAAAILRAVEKC